MNVVASNISLDLLLDGLRHRMKQKGWTSIAALKMLFCGADNGAGVLDYPQFESLLIQNDLVREAAECRIIFDHFDRSRSGALNHEEFYRMVRGGLNDRRKAVVRAAFEQFDTNGNGVVNIEDLKLSFRTAEHPDYLTNQRSETDIFNEFLHNFETLSTNGQITLSEFEEYYESIGALITSDAHFEEVVRSAWNLEGASGGHCLRVHITDSWGRGQRVDIRGDLGVDRHHPRFLEYVKSKLRKKGHDDVARIEIMGRY